MNAAELETILAVIRCHSEDIIHVDAPECWHVREDCTSKFIKINPALLKLSREILCSRVPTQHSGEAIEISLVVLLRHCYFFNSSASNASASRASSANGHSGEKTTTKLEQNV